MAFDLFFASKKIDFSLAALPGFKLDSKQAKARAKVIASLCKDFNVQLDSDKLSATASGFPSGELTAYQGYFHWSLHGEYETARIQHVVDWFYAQNWLCIDPQDAGFDSRDRVPGAQLLHPYDDLPLLTGARLRAVELNGQESEEMTLRWLLADQREAELVFYHLKKCAFPANLTMLIKDHLLSAEVKQTKGPTTHKSDYVEDYCFKFASGGEIQCSDTVVKHLTAFNAPKGKR